MLARIEPLIAVKVEVCEHPCSIVRHPFVFVEQQTIEGLFGGIVFDALRVEGDFSLLELVFFLLLRFVFLAFRPSFSF